MTFKLSVLELQVMGMDVPLLKESEHVLVDTVIPDKESRMLPEASRGLVVPKMIVQYVLTTPIALSWQLTTRDCRGDS